MSRSQKDVAYRLELVREALGKSDAQIGDETRIGRSGWGNFTSMNAKEPRRITIEQAYKLYDTYGITFDWVYLGRRNGLPGEIADGIREIEAQGGLIEVDGKWVRPVQRAG